MASVASNKPSQVFTHRLSLPVRLLQVFLRLIPTRLRGALYQQAFRFGRPMEPPLPSIRRFPLGLVLKSASPSNAVEGDALKFINNLGLVNSPTFIDIVLVDGESYLLSTWVDGCTVGEAWDDMTASDRSKFSAELRDQFSALRSHTLSLPHPICDASGDPVADPRVPWIFFGEQPHIIDDCREFAKEVWTRLNMPRNRETLLPLLQPLIDRRDTPIVFTHGDLLPRNIVLPGGLAAWRSGKEPICVLDWAFAGWMPTYWDPLKATWMEWEEDSDWYKVMREVFPECRVEMDADWQWRSRSGVTIM